MKHTMRKINRLVSDKNELIEIMGRCDVCRIGFFDGEFPYIVPMNFGFDYSDGLTLYFHCAPEGRKLDIIRENNKVCFEMDCSHQLKTGELACQYSMNYECIIGEGEIFIVEDKEEKINGLHLLMKQYGRTADLHYDDKVLSRTVVLKINATDFTGKKLNK